MAIPAPPPAPGDVEDELQGVALFEHDPELLRHVVPEEAERARRSLTVPLVVLPAGEFDVSVLFGRGHRAFAGLVTSGLLAREVTFGGQPTLLLLGPGDLVHATRLDAGLLAGREAWAASGPVHIALLDDHFLRAVRTWPRILTGLMERAADRHDRTVVQLAISQQPRVEDRLVALFRHLAERWGRVTPEGVVITLALTHEALGRIIGARRPTVTLALKALDAEDRLHRRGDGSWVLLDSELGETPPLTALNGNARPAVVVETDELHELRAARAAQRDGRARQDR